MKFKTKPFKHQTLCLADFGLREYFALLAEQGTGKTWIIINNVATLWDNGACDGLLVLAPNGVHHNWVLREIPTHMPDGVRYRMAAWSAGANKTETAKLNSILVEKEEGELRILCMNSEGLQHKRSEEFAAAFASSCKKLMIVVDESSDFKTPSASRTKALMKIRKFAKYRRIMNGTPITNGPFDAFSQFLFLDQSILGTDSFYAFKAEYAKLMPREHGLIRKIMTGKIKLSEIDKTLISEYVKTVHAILVLNGREELWMESAKLIAFDELGEYAEMLPVIRDLKTTLDGATRSKKKDDCVFKLNRIESIITLHERKLGNAMNSRRIPQIVERDKATGNPEYRNLNKLNALISPHSFRVLKKDCLDLPEKIYKYVWFDMTPEQRVIYDRAKFENRLALEGEDASFPKLVAQMKLMQITSGYYLHPDAEEPVRIAGENRKLALLVERAKAAVESGEKIIVWARYRVQIDDVANALRTEGIRVVEYHGGIKKNERNAAIESFERGGAQVFIGQQQAGGRGLTLIAASQVFYYSNTYALDHRLQTEDRAHRIGQEKNVVYTDFCAIETIDYECIERLKSKADVAAIITGDEHAENVD